MDSFFHGSYTKETYVSNSLICLLGNTNRNFLSVLLLIRHYGTWLWQRCDMQSKQPFNNLWFNMTKSISVNSWRPQWKTSGWLPGNTIFKSLMNSKSSCLICVLFTPYRLRIMFANITKELIHTTRRPKRNLICPRLGKCLLLKFLSGLHWRSGCR